MSTGVLKNLSGDLPDRLTSHSEQEMLVFKHLSLRKKLMIGFSAAILFQGLVGAFSYYQLQVVTSDYDHIAEINMPKLDRLAEMDKAFRSVRVELYKLGIDDIPETEARDIAKSYEIKLAEYEASEKEYLKFPITEPEQKAYEAMTSAWTAFKTAGQESVPLALSTDPRERTRFKEFLLKRYDDLAHDYREKMSAVRKQQSEDADWWSKRADVTADFGNRMVIAGVIVGGLFTLLNGFLLSRQVNNQLNGIVSRLSTGAKEIANASEQVSSTSEQLSSAATQQAASLQQTSASVTELSQMVAKNSENAQSASRSSTESQTKANEGKDAVERMIHAIEDIDKSTGDISRQMDESNREISQIIKVIADIQEKTKVIDDIVFQTKLLSFNASVEAARAGEAGKGFSVVAEEVGNLAQMSGKASKEISTLLAESLDKVERTIRESQEKVAVLMDTSRSKVRVGNDVAVSCGGVLEELVQSSTSVQNLAQEISVASQEQASGIQEIDRAVAQLDQVTQQNASAAVQTSSSASDLSKQAEELRNVVEELLSMLHGQANSQNAIHARERAIHTGARSQTRETKPDHSNDKANIVPFRKKEEPDSKPSTAPSSTTDDQKARIGEIPSLDDKRFKDI